MAKKNGAVVEGETRIVDVETGEVLSIQAAADRLDGIAAQADKIRKAMAVRDAQQALADAAKEILKQRQSALRELQAEMTDLVMGQKRLF